MYQRIGSCSLCGGDVVGHVGPWMATIPPPPPTCQQCGATAAADDVIKMKPRGSGHHETLTTGTTT